ncbi:hypothetical protein E2L08_06265 [Palleronia sediminis]|uniref:Uncharacterized protein n=1 Tax=Palleronia sediminis TaxID=2547833 RepID=A0A4R6AIR6_9RHOB|nr:hypothetical protein [Palleronia sediminis]TDL81273.1 hypothetical protein E2L08_06265 [Palleronia sediminis]
MIRDGEVHRPIEVSPDANGLAFLPDEQASYVNNSDGKQIAPMMWIPMGPPLTNGSSLISVRMTA